MIPITFAMLLIGVLRHLVAKVRQRKRPRARRHPTLTLGARSLGPFSLVCAPTKRDLGRSPDLVPRTLVSCRDVVEDLGALTTSISLPFSVSPPSRPS